MFPAIFNFGADLFYIAGIFFILGGKAYRIITSLVTITLCTLTTIAGIIMTVIYALKEENIVA